MHDQISKLLEGAYDVHLHAKPCVQARRRTIFETVQDIKTAGMKGFVVKDHNVSTAPAAQIMAEIEPAVNVIGGVTMNKALGGMNPAAAEINFRLGGKVVWMPSLESAWMLERLSSPDFKSAANYKNLGVGGTFKGYSGLREGKDDQVTDEVREIIALCKQYNGVFETSHFSHRETYAALREAKAQGLNRFVITHSNADPALYSIAEQKELAAMGAAIMCCMAPYMGKPNEPGLDIAELANIVREVGAENIVLGTDFGLAIWPPAVEGMRMMVSALLNMGIPPEDIRLMVRDNVEHIYC